MLPAALLLLPLAADLFTQGLAPLDTGAPPEMLSAQACRDCHDGAHAEWAASRHGQAWTNAIFQREYRQQPLEWCVHCHAPLREQLAEVVRARDTSGAAAVATAGVAPADLAAEGVGCAACHLRAGRVLAARKRAGSPHDTDVRADFGGPAFCGGCHQFNFPIIESDPVKRADGEAAAGQPARGRVVGYSRYPMQDTVAQHARGPRAATPCRQCHAAAAAGAPEGAGSHAYPGGHDPAMLARALSLAACRDGATLRLTVANVGAGHNVPTGDLHRHLALRAWRPSAPERLHETLFGRQFERADDGGKRTVSDTTLPPAAVREVRVPVAALGRAAPGEPIRVELRLVYTIDEFPLRGRELAEPTYATAAARTLDWPHLGGCSRAPRRAGARPPDAGEATPPPRTRPSAASFTSNR